MRIADVSRFHSERYMIRPIWPVELFDSCHQIQHSAWYVLWSHYYLIKGEVISVSTPEVFFFYMLFSSHGTSYRHPNIFYFHHDSKLCQIRDFFSTCHTKIRKIVTLNYWLHCSLKIVFIHNMAVVSAESFDNSLLFWGKFFSL